MGCLIDIKNNNDKKTKQKPLQTLQIGLKGVSVFLQLQQVIARSLHKKYSNKNCETQIFQKLKKKLMLQIRKLLEQTSVN